jgi:hypothetical protein
MDKPCKLVVGELHKTVALVVAVVFLLLEMELPAKDAMAAETTLAVAEEPLELVEMGMVPVL